MIERRFPPAAFVVLLIVVSGFLLSCGEEDGGAMNEGIVDTSVGEVLASPEDFDRVRVQGTGSPLGSAGFILGDAGDAIFVESLQLPALRVDEGDQLTVVGRIGKLVQHQIESLAGETKRAGGRRGSIHREALAALSLEPGSPYIELSNVRGEGGND